MSKYRIELYTVYTHTYIYTANVFKGSSCFALPLELINGKQGWWSTSDVRNCNCWEGWDCLWNGYPTKTTSFLFLTYTWSHCHHFRLLLTSFRSASVRKIEALPFSEINFSNELVFHNISLKYEQWANELDTKYAIQLTFDLSPDLGSVSVWWLKCHSKPIQC